MVQKDIFFGCLLLAVSCFGGQVFAQRKILSLNGVWSVVRTDTLSGIPETFPSKIPVPGLVDMAFPSIEPPYTGPLDLDEGGPFANHFGNRSYRYNNSLYWYRRTFILKDQSPALIELKLNKAMYHTRVYVNGKLAADNVYCFTPTKINIKPFLRDAGKQNDLVISVGCRNNIPDSVCHGDDGEKVLFTPGIYDDVTLISSGLPHIASVQLAPDIDQEQLRIVAGIQRASQSNQVSLSYTVRELVSKKIVATGKAPSSSFTGDERMKADFSISLPGCKHWSPETPFLYSVELNTGSDKVLTRFGMRSFKTDKMHGTVLLNNKTYYLRGTNIAIFRFFEDSLRGALPWNNAWVTRLHLAFKKMHWNSFRNCIGFPPERWYEIADSLGFLIEDEYPLWKNGNLKLLTYTSENLANEYAAWMRERWNHPSVVIWDGQNESVYDTSTVAINKVRNLDLSNRPWENGWSRPASETDVMEAHPYLFGKYFNAYDAHKEKTATDNDFYNLMALPMLPGNSWVSKSKDSDRKLVKFPIIINEYGWFWLNRDGSPTTLDKGIYATMFPGANTPEKRFDVYARVIAMKTEYWRAHRLAAGVLHFCGLSYSRSNYPRGQTSDNFKDIGSLVFEPHYYNYVRAAFSPVSLMINFWESKAKAGDKDSIPVILINETYKEWKGKLTIRLLRDAKIISTKTLQVSLPQLGKQTLATTLIMPTPKGAYELVAEIKYRNEKVQSHRQFSIE